MVPFLLETSVHWWTQKQSSQVSELHFVAQESWRWLDSGQAVGRMGVFQLTSCCSASLNCFLLWVLNWGKCTDLWLLSCHYAGSHSHQSSLCWPAVRPRPTESAARSHVSIQWHVCALVLLGPGRLTVSPYRCLPVGVEVWGEQCVCMCDSSHSCFTSVCVCMCVCSCVVNVRDLFSFIFSSEL